MAARGLLALFRDVDSEMLVKKDRGKVRDQHKKEAFGAKHVVKGVQGLELLNVTDSDEEGSDSDGVLECRSVAVWCSVVQSGAVWCGVL